MHLLYILGYYIIACAYFLIKVRFHWIVPRDCTVGLHYARSPEESWRGYPGRVLSWTIIIISLKYTNEK